jgi:hypothetical protein
MGWMRDHNPITLENFNGLWDRGEVEETPMDHFSECVNLKFVGSQGFASRDGVGRHQDIASPLKHVLRFYNYPTDTANTLLVLTAGGNIYHVVNPTTMFGPILTIPTMEDFGFVPYAGRAYITPFKTEVYGSMNRELGLAAEFVYVYKGDGTAARKAAGNPPTLALTATNGGPGLTDAGVHIFGYVFETDTGYLSAPGGLVAHTTLALNAVDFTNVAISAQAFVTKRHIVASKVIQNYNGDVNGYQLFFIPEATIPNNVGTALPNISFFDQDLLLDASHLFDNYSEIPAGVGLSTYHNRMVLWGERDNISVARVSHVGEPEAISKIDGLLLFPPDGNPITNGAELRDVWYLFKRNKTASFVDNGDVPTSWPITIVDNGMGCGVHGIGTVLDAGSTNIDYLLVGSYKGLTLFNGRYILPELSWKVQNYWLNQDFKNKFRFIQIVNDTVNQIIYLVTTERNVLMGNYANGLDPKKIRWSPWTFQVSVNTLALVNVNELLLGCDQV